MIDTILGTKIRQTQTFTKEGKRIPVTEIKAGPCYISVIKKDKKQNMIQLGFGYTKRNKKPRQGHLKKAGIEKKLRFLRFTKVLSISEKYKLGDSVTVDSVLAAGDEIQVTGVSKGKGFAGVMKRHKFAGGPRTHGQSDRERAPGSIGQGTTPGRVFKGKKMPGRMGNQKVTVKGLRVVNVDAKTNKLIVKGVVPGAPGGLLVIKKKA